MVEIFTTSSGSQAGPQRVVSSDHRLAQPSDVHFGTGAAGIAFFEKSGADLRVTLLDGSKVMLRDFFVIGPEGEFSRLLDGGGSGSVEVTGLVAPEPLVPSPRDSGTQEEAAPKAEAAPAPANGAVAEGDTASLVESGGEGADKANASAGSSFFGMAADQAFFGAAMVPIAATFLTGSGGGSGRSAEGEGGGEADEETTGVPEAAPAEVEMTAGQDDEADIAEYLGALLTQGDENDYGDAVYGADPSAEWPVDAAVVGAGEAGFDLPMPNDPFLFPLDG